SRRRSAPVIGSPPRRGLGAARAASAAASRAAAGRSRRGGTPQSCHGATTLITRVAYGEPTSYLALEAGARVIGSDGADVGRVEHVLADPDSDIFDGLVIDIRPGPGGMHFVDAEHVAELYERAAVLNLTAAQVEQ